MRSECLFIWVFHQRSNFYGRLERPTKFHNAWVLIVSAYTSCKLTLAKDKLVAIEGPAELTKELTGDDFIAGLWRSRIFQGLSWRTAQRLDCKSRLLEYRAPSWSWASVESSIFTRCCTDEPILYPFQLQDVQVITDSVNGSPRGRIMSAYIVLRGHAPSFSMPHGINNPFAKCPRPSFCIRVHLDYPMEKVEKRPIFLLILSFNFYPEQPERSNKDAGQDQHLLKSFGLCRDEIGRVILDSERELQTFKII